MRARLTRFVTLNTWKNDGAYAARVTAMARGLAALDADAVALQECFVADLSGLDTAVALGAALGMQVLRQPMRAKVRMLEGLGIESRSDLAILTRAPVLGSGYRAFAADPRDGDRGLLWADLAIGQTAMRIGCTHLTHLRDAHGAAMRKRQAQAAHDSLLADWTAPALLMGDLNAIADHESVQPLFAAPSLDRACLSAAMSGVEIDHILLFQAAETCAFAGRRVCMQPDRDDPSAGPSDHPAIVVDLAVA